MAPDGTSQKMPWEEDYSAPPSIASPPAANASQAPWEQNYTQPQLKPPPSISDHSTVGDLGRSAWGALSSGTGELVQGIGDIGQKLDQAQGVNTGSAKVQALGKRIEQYGENEQQNVSPEFAKKTSQSILTREGFNPTNIANKAINSIAGMAPALAGTAVASLAGPEVAIPVGAALFGTQGEAGGRNAGEQQVDALSDAQLEQVPRYQQLVQSGMSPKPRGHNSRTKWPIAKRPCRAASVLPWVLSAKSRASTPWAKLSGTH
jgi:hypothetical protein